MAFDLQHVMQTADVARALECSTEWVRRLDDELQPVRTETGRRRYDPERVRAYLARREK